jgi:hypothetical protein
MITQSVAESISAQAHVAAATIAQTVVQKRDNENRGFTDAERDALALGVWAGIFPTLLAANIQGMDTDVICEKLHSITATALQEVRDGNGGRLP